MPPVGLHRCQRQVRVSASGDAEVDHPRLSITVDEDIPGLQVPVNHTPIVPVGHRVADFRKKPEPLHNWQLVLEAVVCDGLGVGNELHHVERHIAVVARVRPDDVDLRDPGVLQTG